MYEPPHGSMDAWICVSLARISCSDQERNRGDEQRQCRVCRDGCSGRQQTSQVVKRHAAG
eukprot:2070788-Prymnesium_polylepis.1